VTAVVGLYLVGDSLAQQAARELAAAQSSVASTGDHGGGQRQVCNKPVTQSKNGSSPDWFKPIFKIGSHSGGPAAGDSNVAPAQAVANPSLSMAMSSLKQLSGN
jgi:hypothetical protein